MKQSEFAQYYQSLLKKEDKELIWELKRQSPRKNFDTELLSSLLLEECTNQRVLKEERRTAEANQQWNIEHAKQGRPPLRNYELPDTKEKRAIAGARKEYSKEHIVPPGAGDAREYYRTISPHRMEKDFVNVAHMIYDHKAEKEALKEKL